MVERTRGLRRKIPPQLSEKLRQFLKQHDLSYSEAAELAGVSLASISRVARADRLAGRKMLDGTLKRVADMIAMEPPVSVLATTNSADDRAGSKELPTHIANRIRPLVIEPAPNPIANHLAAYVPTGVLISMIEEALADLPDAGPVPGYVEALKLKLSREGDDG